MWISNSDLTAFVLVSLAVILVMIIVGFSMEAYKNFKSPRKDSNKRARNKAQHLGNKAPMAVRNK